MSTRLADRLSAARQRRFAGRSAELSLFRDALAAEEPPFAVLYVYGPGGIGKTTLLGEFATLAAQSMATVYSLDARMLEAGPAAFTTTLQRVMGVGPNDAPAQV